MKRILSALTLAAAAFVLHGVSVAQPPAPFEEGEILTYEGKVSKIIQGIAVADLTFEVDRAADRDFLIKAEAKSKGTLLKLFRFSFLQKFESTIDDKNFRVIRTVKQDIQKDRVRDSEALFDYGDKRVTWTETDPKDPMRPPRKIASEIEGTTHDLISGVYSLRMLPLAVGKTFNLKISDSGLVYSVPVKVTGRELQKTEIGRVMCFRVEPQVFGPGRLVESDGKMVIWITDDARRIPVRSQVNASVGKIEIKIKSVSTKRDNTQTAKKN
jgi:hypothetical protein